MSTHTAKQLSRYLVSSSLEDLLALYAEYKFEYDLIADRYMESQPEHDCFFNWLGIHGKEREQTLLQYLQDEGVGISENRRPSFELDPGEGVSVVHL